MAIEEAALTGSPEISAEVWDESGVTVVALAGEFDLSSAPQLRECLVSSQVLAAERVLVDLTRVTFLDSSSIGLLVVACKHVRSAGGAFSVSCSDGMALRVLQISGLVEYFEVESPATRTPPSAR
jgi:anti-sigma B factor antagonist